MHLQMTRNPDRNVLKFSTGTWDGNKKDQSLVLQSIKFNKYISDYFGKGDLVKLVFFAVSTHRCRSLVVLQI